PCIRDLAALLRDHLPPAVVMLTPLEQLARRAQELHHTHPQYREELPLVLSGEARRRARFHGLQVVDGPVRDVPTAQPAHCRA
ncbi:MAG TPA: hypothetical protein VF630_08980, partial [Hymenobacter sp.]